MHSVALAVCVGKVSAGPNGRQGEDELGCIKHQGGSENSGVRLEALLP